MAAPLSADTIAVPDVARFNSTKDGFIMVTRAVTGPLVGFGTMVVLNDPGINDSLYVGRNGVVGSIDGTAVSASGSFQRVTVEGTIFADQTGIRMGTILAPTSYQTIYISATGVVSGDNAIDLFGVASFVNNHGTIDGGINTSGSNGVDRSELRNFGTISDAAAAVFRSGTENYTLFNVATIEGGIYSYFAFEAYGSRVDRINNQGLMIGDITLGGLEDIYDGRGGRVIGAVYGEDGLDTFRPGAEPDSFDGGAGSDLLEFSDTTGVRVYLDGSGVNTLTAQGDTYVGIERVNGSLVGSDVLVGDAAGNILRGFGGIDTLSGGSGADYLIGGTGTDRTTGGTGNDVFQFHVIGDGGDVITDFGNTVTSNDSFRFATTMGGGLVAGALLASQFQSRTDNLAQDANDRFIFRTTDQTLWFDSNGNGAGGLVLMADLQAGAVVTSADIMIV